MRYGQVPGFDHARVRGKDLAALPDVAGTSLFADVLSSSTFMGLGMLMRRYKSKLTTGWYYHSVLYTVISVVYIHVEYIRNTTHVCIHSFIYIYTYPCSMLVKSRHQLLVRLSIKQLYLIASDNYCQPCFCLTPHSA